MKAVGVVKAPPDQIFILIMDYGPERQQIPRRRGICLARYWKREECGAYCVFYTSVLKQPLQPDYVRAYIHSGGYIITPLKTSGSGKPRTLVESVLEMDAAGWSSLLGAGFSGYPTRLRDSLLAGDVGEKGSVWGKCQHVKFRRRVMIFF